MLEQLDKYDWGEVFGFAGEPDTCAAAYHDGASVSAAEGDTQVSVNEFTRDDVVEILVMSDGENDGPSWLGVFRLRDGRFAFLSASCDYTGWDCQAGGAAVVALDLTHLIAFGMGDYDRARLFFSP
jgi:hypothetical protein